MTITSPPGLALDRFGAWFRDAVPRARRELSATLIAGGRSNLTYVVSDGLQDWVVRRPPKGHVLATAHDMAREHRVMSALMETDVPVPRMFALCEDETVIGAPFYVMEKAVGTPYRRAAELDTLGETRTRLIADRLVDTLVALHRVVPESVGLSDFGRPEGYLARQVCRWRKQLDASTCRELPAADELHRRLEVAVPAESATRIVHGDFRLDNVLMNADDRVVAVLDWEMATLGDPLMDLALMLTYHRLSAITPEAGDTDASLAKGFPTEAEIIERYHAGVSGEFGPMGFYLGLAAFKLASILQGIHFRFLQGQTVGEGFDNIGDAIHPLLDAGIDAMKEYH